MIFEAFPKIPRLRRECTITEKIDGTNAGILIAPAAESDVTHAVAMPLVDGVQLAVWAQSRTRFLAPGGQKDNFGFAAWVHDNADELVKLGPGRHFGEWWGAGIQRRYGQEQKRFSLFDTARWGNEPTRPACCDVVPVLHIGVFGDEAVSDSLGWLRQHGSQAAPGFMQPEGIIVYMHASKSLHKVLLENDELPKGVKE